MINSKKTKLYFICWICVLFIYIDIYAQCGIANNLPIIEFNTQTDLNNFENANPETDSLMFNIWIDERIEFEDTIVDLSPLEKIKYIGGTFCVINTEKIKDFNQIDNIIKIEGPINLEYNKSLESLKGFEKLTYVGSDILISDNDKFSSFAGTQNIDTIKGALQITNSPQLKIIDGFNNLQSLERIRIEYCDSLTIFSTHLENVVSLLSISIQETPLQDLNFLNDDIIITESIRFNRLNISEITGFDNITNLSSSLRIEDNFSLTDIDAFSNLKTVENLFLGRSLAVAVTPQSFSRLDSVFRSLTIRNIQLSDLNFFNSLSYVGFNLHVQNSSLLRDLDVYENIVAIPEDVIIENNASLDDCTALCDRIRLGLATTLDSNPGCNSVQELVELCGPSSALSIPLGHTHIFPNPVENYLHIRTKEDIDKFIIYSLEGKELLRSNKSQKIDMSSLSNGFYIVVISYGGRQLIQKIHKI